MFAHCFTCSKDVFAAARISKSLADRGFATLRFDFTGLGHSDGEFGNTNFSSNVADLEAAADFLRREYEAPELLIGHSLGGAAVVVAAGEVEVVAGVATIGAPYDPEHIRQQFGGHIERIEREGEAEVTLAGRTFRITEQFLDDLSSHRMEETIGELKRPLMIFHSPVDDIVGIDNAARIYKAAKHPKNFVSLDGADHLLTRHSDARYVATMLSAWASRYIGEEQAEETETQRPDVDLEAGQVYVGETGEGKFSNHVLAGEHYMRADEPESFGGDDTGPSPYEYVTAGLGACTSMTLRMYADRKGWPVESIEVRLEQDKVHAADCEKCASEEGKIDRIVRRVRLTGDLTDEQRQRLLEIADKCPVHHTLTRSNEVVTELEDERG
ncbi:MAG: alpha/beta fold hydrolase [Bradymonadaceae bacterium]